MLCPHCSTEIPESQSICPRCYYAPRGSSRSATARHSPKNVIQFGVIELFHTWTEKYLQPDRVGSAWIIETATAFIEVSTKSAGMSNVLIVQSIVAEENEELLSSFIQDNPGIAVGVLYSFGENLPSTAPLQGATMFRMPSDVDDWLLMMSQLLD